MDRHAVVQYINAMFDELKRKHHLSTDAQLAGFLDVSNMAIVRWRQGKLNRKIGTVLLPYYTEFLTSTIQEPAE